GSAHFPGCARGECDTDVGPGPHHQTLRKWGQSRVTTLPKIMAIVGDQARIMANASTMRALATAASGGGCVGGFFLNWGMFHSFMIKVSLFPRGVKSGLRPPFVKTRSGILL